MFNLVNIIDEKIVIEENFLKEYKKAKKQFEEFQKIENQLKEELKIAMLELEKDVYSNDGLVAVCTQKKGAASLDSKKIKMDLPEIYNNYLKTGVPTVALSLKIES